MDESLDFKVSTTDFDEEMVAPTRPTTTLHKVNQMHVDTDEGNATVDVYVIGQDYDGRVKLPNGVRCVHVLNYEKGGQQIRVIAEHHEIHRVQPEMWPETIEREKGSELDMDDLLGVKESHSFIEWLKSKVYRQKTCDQECKP